MMTGVVTIRIEDAALQSRKHSDKTASSRGQAVGISGREVFGSAAERVSLRMESSRPGACRRYARAQKHSFQVFVLALVKYQLQERLFGRGERKLVTVTYTQYIIARFAAISSNGIPSAL